jgi:hypothetical protein
VFKSRSAAQHATAPGRALFVADLFIGLTCSKKETEHHHVDDALVVGVRSKLKRRRVAPR